MNRVKARQVTQLVVGLLVVFSLTVLLGRSAQTQYYGLGDIPLDPETYQKHLKVRPKEVVQALDQVLPAAYDARTYGGENIVTPAKNQGSCGSCWAFAAVGGMESHVLKQYGPDALDYSEQQQVSCNNSMAGCAGGSSSSIRYWEGKGPLDEPCFPYTASDSTPCAEAGCVQFPFQVVGWHTVPANTTDFKDSLYTYGPSYWRYNVYSDFDSYWSNGAPGEVYVSKEGYSYRGGHAVLLIGWDDAKGAFLCKNSWGGGGPNNDGTFWIAYSGHYYNLGFGMANFSLTSLGCSGDTECDDGIYCNGAETCVDSVCQAGTPVTCGDDGLFCTGTEFCNESLDGCDSTGDPCDDGTVCDEATNACELPNCGNDVCEEGEDCDNCSLDCISGSTGGTDCGACFKGICNGVCHPKEVGTNCPDCAASYCCGDGTCEGAEDGFNCAIDCGDLPASETNCTDGIDNDDDGQIDCADSDCAAAPQCTSLCLARGEVCSTDDECCSGDCHDVKGTCK